MNSTSRRARRRAARCASPSPVAADGVRRHLEQLARAARREHDATPPRARGGRAASRIATPRHAPSSTSSPTATACSRISETVPCVAATRARSTSAPVAAPPACRIRAWECPPSRARCRAPVASRSKTAPSAISSSTRARPLVDEDPDGVHVAQPRAGPKRVGEVQVRRVLVVVQDRGDAALGPPRRRLGQRRLRDDADLDAGVGEPHGDGQPRDAAADDEGVEASRRCGRRRPPTLSMSRTPSTMPATSSRSVAPGSGSTAARSVEGSTAAA